MKLLDQVRDMIRKKSITLFVLNNRMLIGRNRIYYSTENVTQNKWEVNVS